MKNKEEDIYFYIAWAMVFILAGISFFLYSFDVGVINSFFFWLTCIGFMAFFIGIIKKDSMTLTYFGLILLVVSLSIWMLVSNVFNTSMMMGVVIVLIGIIMLAITLKKR
jgi:hypothetical protein